MGTHFQFDEMLRASDTEARSDSHAKRQVEVFIPSGTSEIHLRVGELNKQHMGTGYSVELSTAEARQLIDGIENAIRRLGN